MKKTVAILTILIITLTLTSCSLFGELSDLIFKREETLICYGVVTHLDELDNTCLYVPRTGHISFPSLKDGSSAEYDVGDIVKLTFTVKGGDLPIMESFPARFGQPADKAEVKDSAASIEFIDGKWLYDNDIPEGLDPRAGDEIIINKGESEYARADVKAVSDGRFHLELRLSGEMKDFLGELFADGLSMTVVEDIIFY